MTIPNHPQDTQAVAFDPVNALPGTEGMTPQPLPANKPLCVAGTHRVWQVITGKVELFLLRDDNGSPVGRRHPIASVDHGGIFMGLEFARDCPGWQVLAIGSPETQVVEVARDVLHPALSNADTAASIVTHIERWLLALCDAQETELVPEDALVLPPPATRTTITLQPGQSGMVRAGVLWLETLQGTPLLMGDPQWRLVPLAAPLALPRNTWITATEEPAILEISDDPASLLRNDPDWGAMRRLQRLTLFSRIDRITKQVHEDRTRMVQQAKDDQGRFAADLQGLANVLDAKPIMAGPADSSNSALLKACSIIGHHSGIRFMQHPTARTSRAQRDPLGDILRASQVRWRAVALAGLWWRRDSGHLLAFDATDGRPLALIARSSGGGYDIHDPVHGTVARLSDERASQLKPEAKTFFRSLPSTPLSWLDLMRFAAVGRQFDLLFIVLLALLMGLLGLVAPWVTGRLIDHVIPHADRSQLVMLGAGLLGTIFATSLLAVSQSFTQLRTETKVDSAVQAAVWDRLLKLPATFFRSYPVVDLSMRANAISSIRQALSGSTLRSVLSSLFSVMAIGLMATQSAALTVVGLGLVIVVVVLNAAGSALTLRYERQLAELAGKSNVLQLLAGVQKIRAAGAEKRAFSKWAQQFSLQQSVAQRITRIGNMLGSVGGVYPVLATLVIFASMAVWKIAPDMTTGQFLVFNAAFGMLMGSMLTLAHTGIGLIRLVPLYERAKPILQATPEVDEAKADPGVLDGRIELNDLTFSYRPDLPPTIHGLSVSIRAGEFVAVVGPSGCGKSTLLRLLLGFEKPQQGSISYSDKDLNTLDITALRRQLGVVLQNGQLMEGDIYSNIAGSRPLGKAAVEEAIDKSGFRRDIEAMPMGMHTVVADRGATLSGGQRQRLLIARAIVHKPRIVFLDEATSALDHRTQQHVMQSFEQLQATRIVIAHRLSTVVNADRILVMQAGQLVEQGTYAELMERGGLFSQLARRQIA